MQDTRVAQHEIARRCLAVAWRVACVADALSTVKQSDAFASRSTPADNYTPASHARPRIRRPETLRSFAADRETVTAFVRERTKL